MKTLTKHRDLIYQDLKERKDHPTAKMVFDSVKEKAERISFATVYNSLEYLVQHKMVKKLNIESESARYDGCLESHSHLICQNCGRILDIPQAKLSSETDFGGFSFSIQEIEVNILGNCKTCDNSP